MSVRHKSSAQQHKHLKKASSSSRKLDPEDPLPKSSHHFDRDAHVRGRHHIVRSHTVDNEFFIDPQYNTQGLVGREIFVSKMRRGLAPNREEVLIGDICEATRRGDIFGVRKLIRSNNDEVPFDINAPTPMWPDWPPLHIAVELRNWRMADALIQLGADIDSLCEYSGGLVHNCRRVDVLRRLKLHYGADMDLQWGELGTALHLRAKEGDVKMCKALVKLECDVNAKTKSGDSPLDVAGREGHASVIHYLERHGGEVSQTLVTKLKRSSEIMILTASLVTTFLQLASFPYLIEDADYSENPNVGMSVQYLEYVQFYVAFFPLSLWTWKFIGVLGFTLFYLVAVGTTKTRRFARYMKDLRSETEYTVHASADKIRDGEVVNPELVDAKKVNRCKVKMWGLVISARDMVAFLACTVLFIPSMHVFFEVFDCAVDAESGQLLLEANPEFVCWELGHIALAVATTLVLSVYIPVCIRLAFVEGKVSGIADDSFWSLDFQRWKMDRVVMPPERFHFMRKKMSSRKFDVAFVIGKILITGASVFFTQHEEILLFVYCGLSVFLLILTFVVTPFESRHVNSFVVALAAFVVAANFIALLYGNHISPRIADLLLEPANFIAFFVAASVLAFVVGELVFYTMYYRDPTGDRRYHVPDITLKLQNEQRIVWGDSGRRNWRGKNDRPPAVVKADGLPEIMELLPQRTPRVHQHRQFYSKEAEARERAFMKREREEARRLSNQNRLSVAHARMDSKEFKESRTDSVSVEMVPRNNRRSRADSRDVPILSRISSRSPENFPKRDLRRDPSPDVAVGGHGARRFSFGDDDDRSPPPPRSRRKVNERHRDSPRHASSRSPGAGPLAGARSNDDSRRHAKRRNLEKNGSAGDHRRIHSRSPPPNDGLSDSDDDAGSRRELKLKSSSRKFRDASNGDLKLKSSSRNLRDASRREQKLKSSSKKFGDASSGEPKLKSSSKKFRDASSGDLKLKSSSRNLRDASRREQKLKSSSRNLMDLKSSSRNMRDLKSSSRNLRDLKSSSRNMRDLKSSSRNLRDASRQSRKNLRDASYKENDGDSTTRSSKKKYGSASRRSRKAFDLIPEDSPVLGSSNRSKRDLGEDSRRSRRKLRDMSPVNTSGTTESKSKLFSSSKNFRDESRRRKLASDERGLGADSRRNPEEFEEKSPPARRQRRQNDSSAPGASASASPATVVIDIDRKQRKRDRKKARRKKKAAAAAAAQQRAKPPVVAYYPGLDRHYVVTEEHLAHTAVTSGVGAGDRAIRLPRNERRRDAEPSSFYSMQRGQRAPPASQFLMRDLRRDRVIAV